MNHLLDIGDPVRVTGGPYKGLEGVVEDVQPECDAVRIHTKEGSAYAFLEDAVRIPKPIKTKAPLRKR